MRKLFVDIETYSSSPLRDVGVYAYSEAEDFQVLMAAYALDDGPVRVIVGEKEIVRKLGPLLGDRDILKVAHNAQFERVCLSALLLGTEGVGPGEERLFMVEDRWEDTMALAAEWGYPLGLAELAAALGGEQKDAAGRSLIRLFCQPRSAGKLKGTRVLPEDKIDEWMEFVDYCAQDVETLRSVYDALPGWPTQAERDLWEADQRINDRGIRLDTEMAALARDAGEENRVTQAEELRQLTGVQNPNSTAQLLPALQALGYAGTDLQADTVRQAAQAAPAGPLRSALELRLELALAASKKYARALDCVGADGRLRGSFQFYGAHTGRWAGRGIQPQNLPRAQLETEAHVDAAIMDLRMGLGADSATLKALVRALFVGPFTVVDYSAIEARVLAWLAQEQWALDAFEEGRDIYVETAQRMSTPGNPLDRSHGKVAVLALGYNGGVGSLRSMGAGGSDEALQALVIQWRKANSRIVQLWAQLDRAFRHGGQAGPHLRVEAVGDARVLWLPSGRALCYRGYELRGNRHTFWDPRRRLRADTYGGRLAENVTQAVARDLLGAGLVGLTRNGILPVGHVHDEVIVEGSTVKRVNTLLCDPVPWAEGLPVNGEGMQCRRYRK